MNTPLGPSGALRATFYKLSQVGQRSCLSFQPYPSDKSNTKVALPPSQKVGDVWQLFHKQR